jgi:hypothetical protein
MKSIPKERWTEKDFTQSIELRHHLLNNVAHHYGVLDKYGNVLTDSTRIHYIHGSPPLVKPMHLTKVIELEMLKPKDIVCRGISRADLLHRLHELVNVSCLENEALIGRMVGYPQIKLSIETFEVTCIPFAGERRGGTFVTLVPHGQVAHYATVKCGFDDVGTLPVSVNCPVYFVNDQSKTVERGKRRLAMMANYHTQCLGRLPHHVRGHELKCSSDGFISGEYGDDVVYLTDGEIRSLAAKFIAARRKGDLKGVVRTSEVVEKFVESLNPWYWKHDYVYAERSEEMCTFPRRNVSIIETDVYFYKHDPMTMLGRVSPDNREFVEALVQQSIDLYYD